MYLPARISSTLDVLTNGLGGLIGALIAARQEVCKLHHAASDLSAAAVVVARLDEKIALMSFCTLFAANCSNTERVGLKSSRALGPSSKVSKKQIFAASGGEPGARL